MQQTISLYLASLVKNYDSQLYLCNLLNKKSLIDDSLAIYALDIELKKILISNQAIDLKLIKLNWWHQSIDHLYSAKMTNQPIIRAISLIIDKFNVNQQIFEEQIIAYIRLAEEELFTNDEEYFNIITQAQLPVYQIISSFSLKKIPALVSPMLKNLALANMLLYLASYFNNSTDNRTIRMLPPSIQTIDIASNRDHKSIMIEAIQQLINIYLNQCNSKISSQFYCLRSLFSYKLVIISRSATLNQNNKNLSNLQQLCRHLKLQLKLLYQTLI